MAVGYDCGGNLALPEALLATDDYGDRYAAVPLPVPNVAAAV